MADERRCDFYPDVEKIGRDNRVASVQIVFGGDASVDSDKDQVLPEDWEEV